MRAGVCKHFRLPGPGYLECAVGHDMRAMAAHIHVNWSAYMPCFAEAKSEIACADRCESLANECAPDVQLDHFVESIFKTRLKLEALGIGPTSSDGKVKP